MKERKEFMKKQTLFKLIVALVVIAVVSSAFMSCGLFGGKENEGDSESSSQDAVDTQQ